MKKNEVISVKKFLDQKLKEYNQYSFIEKDPISIPHRFTLKQDIEIAGFFAAIFAWGNRTTIINRCNELISLMDDSPYNFIVHHTEKELKKFLHFKLIRQIKFLTTTSDYIFRSNALRQQVTHQGRPHHTSVPSHIYFRVRCFVHV